VITINGTLSYDTPKTKGSRRKVPLMAQTTDVLRDYLASHPRTDESTAPLFCSGTLLAHRPTGRRATDSSGTRTVPTAVEVLATLPVSEAADRIVLDWSAPLRHQTFYKAIFRPAVARANRIAKDEGFLPVGLKFHALRHTYASLCIAAGISPLHLSRFMGHAKVTTTLSVYTHLFDDDHTETMAALEAMSLPATANNVIAMPKRSAL
jgi:integrase